MYWPPGTATEGNTVFQDQGLQISLISHWETLCPGPKFFALFLKSGSFYLSLSCGGNSVIILQVTNTCWIQVLQLFCYFVSTSKIDDPDGIYSRVNIKGFV